MRKRAEYVFVCRDPGLFTRGGLPQSLIASLMAFAIACQDVGVTAVPVLHVEVDPPTLTIVIDQTARLAVMLTDGSGNELLDRTVTWSVEDGDVAEVDSTGNVRALAVGTTRVTAMAEGQTGEGTITVLPKPVGSITIDPDSLTLDENETATVSAIVRAGDGTQLTDRIVEWASDDEAIATVSGTGSNRLEATVTAHGCRTLIASCTTQISATAEGVSGEATVTVRKTVGRIRITPAAPGELVPGATLQLTAQVLASDDTDLTSTRAVGWTSSATGTAQVSPTGLVTATGPSCAAGQIVCTARITASADGVSDHVVVPVLKAVDRVIVSPGDFLLLLSQPVTFVAELRAADGTTLAGRSIGWDSSRPGNTSSPCPGLAGSGPASVDLNPTTGNSTTATVRGMPALSELIVWAGAEGRFGCARLRIVL